MTPEAFAVVVPAQDEAELVGDCLDSVVTAVRGAGVPVAVVLVAHRCSDDTEAVARRQLSRLSGRSEGRVLRLGHGTVATARSAGNMAALHLLAAYGVPFDRTWLLSTDADSRVPADWLRQYGRWAATGAHAVAGHVRVSGWEDGESAVSRTAREAYNHLLRTTGPHVYAANLGVRADAYLEAGGWPDQVPGEEHALLAALRERGRHSVSAPEIVVGTSGRQAARAAGGLGELLGRLASAQSTPAGTFARAVPRQALRSQP
ncbi:glycosyltransferase family 2 protein [Kineosporia succinea]|uniref:Glycosyltransferase involved in cell wall biosynthesis n=1 Tax=Kineosporia succinea TaxID=84632 RepID=A0ABT9P4J7_9ACTN|nr:glycosyltransferase [Kineosporia succinea]MDP9827598.1 glycosyltransferase involved in cell wall biosynthesis [Kineosporia succinea]